MKIRLNKRNKKKYKVMPNPSLDEINSSDFEAIWEIIKDWDINARDYYDGYTSGNGSHVKLILDNLKIHRRDNNIGEIIGE